MKKIKKKPKGFKTSAMHVGFKYKNLDFAVILSENRASAAALFTTNKFKGAPLVATREYLSDGKAQAIVVNSGNANAGNGKQGIKDAKDTAKLISKKYNILQKDVIVASTGVIGRKMPMNLVKEKIKELPPLGTNYKPTEKAILTTDLTAKTISVDVQGAVIKGFAKGSGMIHPDMATMLAFILTDANIAPKDLQKMLNRAVDNSFNAISVDGDMSCNDMVVALANGASGKKPNKKLFQNALDYVCKDLAKKITADGEGASKFFEIEVKGCKTSVLAKQIARDITTSPLVKTMLAGEQPNWGRLISRVGSNKGNFSLNNIELKVNGHRMFYKGEPIKFLESAIHNSLKKKNIYIMIDLHQGDGRYSAYGCDLTEDYVKINATYLS